MRPTLNSLKPARPAWRLLTSRPLSAHFRHSGFELRDVFFQRGEHP